MKNSQGLLLACLLLNLALERVIRDLRVETTGTISYKSTQILAYAEDIDIIGLWLSYVAKAYQGIEQVTENLGLHINGAQTKLMVATSAGLPINNTNLQMVNRLVIYRLVNAMSSQNSTILGQRSAITIAWKLSCAQGCWLPTGHSTAWKISSPQRTCRDGRRWDYMGIYFNPRTSSVHYFSIGIRYTRKLEIRNCARSRTIAYIG